MAVDADAASPDYGTIRLLRVTSEVPGPEQVQNKLNSLSDVANFVRDMKGADSDIEYGNLLTVPLDGGFLYVEPVYAQGRNSHYPLLKKVAVSYADADSSDGDTTAFENNLGLALNKVFGVDGQQTEPPPTGNTTKPPHDRERHGEEGDRGRAEGVRRGSGRVEQEAAGLGGVRQGAEGPAGRHPAGRRCRGHREAGWQEQLIASLIRAEKP